MSDHLELEPSLGIIAWLEWEAKTPAMHLRRTVEEEVITVGYPIFRRGINSGGRTAPVTLGYPPGVAVPGHRDREGRARQGFCEPQKPHKRRDAAADPHRNPTIETAHSGTLVMRVKGTENSRSVSVDACELGSGAFPGKCSRDDKTPENGGRQFDPALTTIASLAGSSYSICVQPVQPMFSFQFQQECRGMPRSVVVSGWTGVGADPDPDLWDFCGARRRLPAVHAVGSRPARLDCTPNTGSSAKPLSDLISPYDPARRRRPHHALPERRPEPLDTRRSRYGSQRVGLRILVPLIPEGSERDCRRQQPLLLPRLVSSQR